MITVAPLTADSAEFPRIPDQALRFRLGGIHRPEPAAVGIKSVAAVECVKNFDFQVITKSNDDGDRSSKNNLTRTKSEEATPTGLPNMSL